MARALLIRIDPGDGLPIYRQIVEQVKAAIASGALAEGDRLPSHRELAREIVVAPLTVARAYDVLEREGFLQRARGRGAFVAVPPKHAESQAARQLNGRASALVRQAQALGLTREEALRALRDAWQEGKEKP